MKRTPAQSGPFAAWLKRRRTERYARQADALADLRRLAGIAISPSEFAQWESGSRIPREDNPKRLRLIEFFGGWTDEAQTESPATSDGAGLSDLYAKLDRQAEVIDRLAAAVEALVQAQPTPEDLIELLRSGLLGPVGAAGRGDVARQP